VAEHDLLREKKHRDAPQQSEGDRNPSMTRGIDSASITLPKPTHADAAYLWIKSSHRRPRQHRGDLVLIAQVFVKWRGGPQCWTQALTYGAFQPRRSWFRRSQPGAPLYKDLGYQNQVLLDAVGALMGLLSTGMQRARAVGFRVA